MHEGYEYAGMKILIVEDTPENITVLRKVLERLELSVSIALDGETALTSAPEIDPDLILLNVGLPGIEGFEVCSRFKKDATFKKIPSTFLTAMTDTESMVKGFALGGIDYIAKPYNHLEKYG